MDTKKNALEVSSKGTVLLGKNIGAFSLKYNGIPLENIFQSSNKTSPGIINSMRQKKRLIKDLYQLCMRMQIMLHPTNAIKKLDLK